MAKKRTSAEAAAATESIRATLEELERQALTKVSGDWDGMGGMALGRLVDLLVRADAGLMIRAADHGKAVASGLYVGGLNQWETSRDPAELVDRFERIMASLEAIVGRQKAPELTAKGRKAVRGS